MSCKERRFPTVFEDIRSWRLEVTQMAEMNAQMITISICALA